MRKFIVLPFERYTAHSTANGREFQATDRGKSVQSAVKKKKAVSGRASLHGHSVKDNGEASTPGLSDNRVRTLKRQPVRRRRVQPPPQPPHVPITRTKAWIRF